MEGQKANHRIKNNQFWLRNEKFRDYSKVLHSRSLYQAVVVSEEGLP